MTTTRTPSHPVRRVAAACALAVVGALLAPAPPAHAWTEGACAEGAGITVVVDFEGFRDEVLVRCAPAPVESGYDALTKVGLEWTPTQRFPGFLCRIEGFPADDPCVNTPPPDAYWGYWRAEHGGTWEYSQHGPATSSPPPGPVEGWRFSTGDDAPPRVAPPAAAAGDPEPSPTSTPAPPPAPTADPTPSRSPMPAETSPPSPSEDEDPAQDEDPGQDEAPDPGQVSPTPTATRPSDDPPSPSPTAPSTSPTSSPTATATPTTTATADASDLPDDLTGAQSASEQGGGPPVATLVSLGLVLALAAAAAATAYRRRRS